ncbi:hypothetical protein [Streptomyces cyaneofuscatus]|uniref:hypothetical protein n=1 Tax=Streptomyces cyaneofuscatus TaxID=66883 RepID=UPI0038083D20
MGLQPTDASRPGPAPWHITEVEACVVPVPEEVAALLDQVEQQLEGESGGLMA